MVSLKWVHQGVVHHHPHLRPCTQLLIVTGDFPGKCLDTKCILVGQERSAIKVSGHLCGKRSYHGEPWPSGPGRPPPWLPLVPHVTLMYDLTGPCLLCFPERPTVCLYIYIYIYIYTHKHTHTYIYIYEEVLVT